MDVFFWDRDDKHLKVGCIYKWKGKMGIVKARDQKALVRLLEEILGHCAATFVQVENGPPGHD